MAKAKEEKSISVVKAIFILLIIFIILPLAIGAGVYFMNDDIQLTVNEVLSEGPGFIGDYFSKFPTQAEKIEKINSIAKHYLSIDSENAKDKLLLIKNEDSSVYDEVVKNMLRINPNKTKIILEKIRDNTIQKDLITSTLENIEKEQNDNLAEQAKYLESIDIASAVDEMNTIIEESINGHKNLASIIELMDPIRASILVNKLSVIDQDKLDEFLTESVRIDLNKKTSARLDKIKSLENAAEVYALEKASDLTETLTNENTYTLEELSIIFKNLGPKKTGEILAASNNTEFARQVVDYIQSKEELESWNPVISKDILKSLKIYNEFDDNVNELVSVYNNMETQKVANLINRMMKKTTPETSYLLDNGEVIVIDDEDIAIELLSQFSQSKIAEIISFLDEQLATEITKKMAVPKN